MTPFQKIFRASRVTPNYIGPPHRPCSLRLHATGSHEHIFKNFCDHSIEQLRLQFSFWSRRGATNFFLKNQSKNAKTRENALCETAICWNLDACPPPPLRGGYLLKYSCELFRWYSLNVYKSFKLEEYTTYSQYNYAILDPVWQKHLKASWRCFCHTGSRTDI